MKNDEKPMVFDGFSLMKTSKKPNDFHDLATPATGAPMKNNAKTTIFDGFSLMSPLKNQAILMVWLPRPLGGLWKTMKNQWFLMGFRS